MQVEVKVPEMEGIESVTVTYWHCKEGDEVSEGADLVEAATEKATFNISSPVSGVLLKKNFQEGDYVETGGIIAVIKKGEVKK